MKRLILLLPLIILSACVHTSITYIYDFKIDCENCETTKDGIINIGVSTIGTFFEGIDVYIKNKSDSNIALKIGKTTARYNDNLVNNFLVFKYNRRYPEARYSVSDSILVISSMSRATIEINNKFNIKKYMAENDFYEIQKKRKKLNSKNIPADSLIKYMNRYVNDSYRVTIAYKYLDEKNWRFHDIELFSDEFDYRIKEYKKLIIENVEDDIWIPRD